VLRLKKKYQYEWPRPAVTVDVVLFTVAGSLQDLRLQVLLVRRDGEPMRGWWALPGGFVRENEDLPAAAARELEEETGVTDAFLEQVTAVGTPGRDPRGHTVTVVWMGLVKGDRHKLAASGDASECGWFDVAGPGPLPKLAFDHAVLLQAALDHLRRRVAEAPLCFELLPDEFTLSELQALLEAILGRTLDRRNFRRKVDEIGILAPVPDARREGPHRPAQLYRFVPEAFAAHTARARLLPF
jgi:ADP-ribose pyrophosphatase YjhB (NUDIX family)